MGEQIKKPIKPRAPTRPRKPKKEDYSIAQVTNQFRFHYKKAQPSRSLSKKDQAALAELCLDPSNEIFTDYRYPNEIIVSKRIVTPLHEARWNKAKKSYDQKLEAWQEKKRDYSLKMEEYNLKLEAWREQEKYKEICKLKSQIRRLESEIE